MQTKTHLRPNLSERYPTGQMEEAEMTPMKKQAPRNPSLDLVSQSVPAYSTQLLMYWLSFVSAEYSDLSKL